MSVTHRVLLASRSPALSREEKAWCAVKFDYVIRSKRVGVHAESLFMFSSEKRLRTDPSSVFLLITRSESLLNSNPYYIVLVSLARYSRKERGSG